jgi:methane monooxygenase PmoA-like
MNAETTGNLMNLFKVKGLLLLLMSVSCLPKESPFSLHENNQGIELLENERPVFFYQREPKTSTEATFNNYLHPLYNLKGDTLTEEFPEDHPHHRGIFWAWHQLYIEDKSVGDGWTMENISTKVVSTETKLGMKAAELNAHVLWKSSVFQNGVPFAEEHTSIIVHQQQPGIRKIDFEISLKALVPAVQIGGSEDIKGYGGFCARIKLPKSITFTSANGSVIPLEGQVVAGSWMDFSQYDSIQQVESGLAILCHPDTPNYPAPWILRQTGSMQNIVYPGEKRINLSMDEPTILRYRLIIHHGNASTTKIASLQLEYEQETINDN